MRVEKTSQGRNVWRVRTASEVFGRQKGVHRARSEPFQIQGHKLETKRLEDAGEFGRHLRTEGARQLGLGNFDPDNFAMVTDAELPKTKVAECILAALDRVKRFPGNRPSILDPRRKAC